MLDATPLLRSYAKRRLHRLVKQDPVSAQRQQLMKLIERGRGTRFGRDHGLDGVATIEEFQDRVPLRTFDEFWQHYWSSDFPRLVDCTWPGTIPFFAETSGTTTGRTKHIPCTREMIRANTRAGLDILVHHVANRPRTRLLGGLNFMLGGSSALHRLAPGISTADLSGIAATVMPWWARLRYFPPRALEAIPDWESRIEALAAAALGEDIRSISGTPSWLLVLFDRLVEKSPRPTRRLAEYFPNLEMIVHGAVNFAPYRSSFDEWLDGSMAVTREVYPASEGFIAIADRGDGEGLRLILDNGLFFEFVPRDELASAHPTRHWLATAETGLDYALVLTTCSGLWSYVIGDTVKLIDRDPPRVLVTGRTTYMLSAFGEHLIDVEIEAAVSAAAMAIDAHIADFSVGPVFPTADQTRGGHVYVVEFRNATPGPDAVARFGALVDEALIADNEDYRAHRAGMVAPRIEIAEPGTFYAWMKHRGKLGGQNKVPRIINDPDLLEDLRRFANARAGE
ncbi:MAG: GH3 auxin-responsive promoter family protein [Alphaproteobacteria bacterium]|nr:GH3 auxin-responsive promoter family protein [Alphaproteobacteria bacterium]